MDINDVFDGIMKSINQFADEIAEQRLQEKMQETGRGPENGGKNAENFTLRHPWFRGLTTRTMCVQSARPAPWCAGEREAGYNGFPEKGVIGAAAPTP